MRWPTAATKPYPLHPRRGALQAIAAEVDRVPLLPRCGNEGGCHWLNEATIRAVMGTVIRAAHRVRECARSAPVCVSGRERDLAVRAALGGWHW